MGLFAKYLYDGSRWLPHDGEDVDLPEPWLAVDIHDSDFATVTYRPADAGTGTAYLGYTPRVYFADERASAPTDVAREASGLTAWWERTHERRTNDAERAAKETELAAFLAPDVDPDEGDEGLLDDLDFDEAEIFVEVKTAHFLAALDLPLPEDME